MLYICLCKETYASGNEFGRKKFMQLQTIGQIRRKIIMPDKTLLSLLVTTCLLLVQVRSENFEENYLAADIYKIFNINPLTLKEGFGALDDYRKTGLFNLEKKVVKRLNDFLVDRTPSIDPDENLDLVNELYLIDLKNKVPSVSQNNQVRRLLLALRTLTGENKCNYYSFIVLSKNLQALGTNPKSIIENKNLRRIDKILAHYINQHVDECRSIYSEKFDAVTKNFDAEDARKLDVVLKSKIESAISDQKPDNLDKSRVERLYSAATFKIRGAHDFDPEEVYNSLREMSANDPDARYMVPVENEWRGSLTIRQDKFDQMYSKYIAEPCAHFRNEYGPDVFKPMDLDKKYSNKIQEDRADFYEAWFKFGLCIELLHQTRNDVKSYVSRL